MRASRHVTLQHRGRSQSRARGNSATTEDEKWRIDCHLLAGRCTIEIEGKPPVDLKSGDVFIVETGAKGTWTVHEDLRKYYVFALGH